MKYIIPILFLLFSCACSKNLDDKFKNEHNLYGNWKMETIREGTHNWGGVILPPTNDQGINVFVMFDESIKYKLEDVSYQDSWSVKLFGLIEADELCGFKPQHDASAMWAVRWYDERLQIAWYNHKDCDSTFSAGFMRSLQIGEPYLLQLYAADGKYRYRILDRDINQVFYQEIPRAIKGTGGLKGRLGVSFGGKYPAPQDIRIYYKIWK